MSSGRLLRRILKSGVQGDPEAFRSAAEEVIREERAKQHHLLANDLERILYGEGTPLRHTPVRQPRPEVPLDKERGLALVELREPVRELDDLVLSDENRSAVEEVILEHGRSEVLRAHGLHPVNRLLFCGPPGCGKTVTAEAIAAELSLELVTVRFDAVVSSFLGETSANLRKVFDFLDQGWYVALFDEFDAIGKERSDVGEHGELKRVVNSFLQMMDSYQGKSLLIAATNHESMLDTALWRRFEEVLFFERPNLEQIRQLIPLKLRAVRWELPMDDLVFLNQFRGLSHADIERSLLRAVKSMVLQGREHLTRAMVEEALAREMRRTMATGGS